MAYQTLNPYTNQVIKKYANVDDSFVENALTKADNLYRKWRNEPNSVEKRMEILQNIADQIRKDRDEISTAIVNDMGKLFSEAQQELDVCISIAEYYAKNAKTLLSDKGIQTPTGQAHVEYHSTGVIMAVEPWNFPFYQVMRVFAPNFALGNPLLFKLASNTPGSAVAFEKVVKDAGAPEGSCINLFVSYDQIDNIIADKRVSGVALTGSEKAGQQIAASAGRNLTKSSMELGGSDPFIVLDDADLTELQKVLRVSRLANVGQICVSSKRLIVTEKNYAKVLQMYKEAFSDVKLGDPFKEDTTLAPLSSKRAKQELIEKVNNAVKHVATLEFGKVNEDLSNNFFEPVILTNLTPDNPEYWDEFFGPVGLVFKVKDEQEAVTVANKSNYGLGGTIFGADYKHAAKIASQVETGMVVINHYFLSVTYPELPFGGVKNSGYGRELSEEGIKTFANAEMIYINKDDPVI